MPNEVSNAISSWSNLFGVNFFEHALRNERRANQRPCLRRELQNVLQNFSKNCLLVLVGGYLTTYYYGLPNFKRPRRVLYKTILDHLRASHAKDGFTSML